MMGAQNNENIEPMAAIPRAVNEHFTNVARKYRNIRLTDSEVIAVIVEKMNALDHVEILDIGCGNDRYDLLLYKHLEDKLRLTCLDANAETLKSLTKELDKHKIDSFNALESKDNSIPLADNSINGICTFNAAHRLELPRFLAESSRILKSEGYLFIYTRVGDQNQPKVGQKEIGTNSLDVLKQSIDAIPEVTIESIVFFAFSRMAAMEQLMERARSHRYYTFYLYSAEELKEALKGFSINLQSEFEDPNQIRWFDENILFVVKKK